MTVSSAELMPIGRFARLTGLTVKAIRHYGEVGLLEPAHVDPVTGYRFYGSGQVRDGEAIRRLRALELPLEEVRAVLRADGATMRERLAVHRARLEGRAVETERILAELDRLVEGKEPLVPEPDPARIRLELTIEDVPAQRVLQIRERCAQDDAGTVIPRALAEVAEYLDELGEPLAPANFCVCPFANEEGVVELAIGWPVGSDLPGRGQIEAAELPAARALVFLHRGPYTALSESYRLLAEVMEENGLEPAGDPVEWYLTDPEETPDPGDYETRIVWPIGPGGELGPPAADVLRTRPERR